MVKLYNYYFIEFGFLFVFMDACKEREES